MDTPATSRKRPASSPLNDEARQPTARIGNISPPRVLLSATPRALRSAPTLPPSPPRRNFYTVRFKVYVVEWQRKNAANIHRSAKHFSIEGGHNRERKCRILRISPPPLRFLFKAKVAKGGGVFAGHYGTLSVCFCKSFSQLLYHLDHSLFGKLVQFSCFLFRQLSNCSAWFLNGTTSLCIIESCSFKNWMTGL